MRKQMADLRIKDYEYRIAIERASRAKRKEVQRPLKNARQQVRNRLLSGSKFLLQSKEVERLYNLPCYNCGSTENLSIDHVIPLARGGNHSIGNLMTLCRKCNASKGKKFLVEWKRDLMKVAGN
jgi:5-methylcytosine-specific restriction endonuclease McrA